jgi:GNAT superfamily N-acetyltransferase
MLGSILPFLPKKHSVIVHKLIKNCFESQLSSVYEKDVIRKFISINSAARLKHDAQKQKMLVAKFNGKIVAFMSFIQHSKYIRLFRLFVDPAYQHRNIGTNLIVYLKKFQKPILIESALYRPTMDFYSKNDFIFISQSNKEIGNGLKCPVALMKYYPVNNVVKIGIKKGKSINYLCVGDVLYGLKKKCFNRIYSKLKKKHIFEEKNAILLIKKLKTSGCIEPLAEYPFYDLVVFNGKH